MSAFDTATKFFHACESLQGWEGCRPFTADGARFEAQCEPLVDVTTVEDYTNWWAGLGSGPLVGCEYTLRSSAWDEANRTALFFATVAVAHTGEGGPVPPTGLGGEADYAYAIRMDEDDRVTHLTKVWNAPWSMRALGWM